MRTDNGVRHQNPRLKRCFMMTAGVSTRYGEMGNRHIAAGSYEQAIAAYVIYWGDPVWERRRRRQTLLRAFRNARSVLLLPLLFVFLDYLSRVEISWPQSLLSCAIILLGDKFSTTKYHHKYPLFSFQVDTSTAPFPHVRFAKWAKHPCPREWQVVTVVPII